ncbi:FAD-dependent oxidoreductase [Paracoccus binzhouensis]|uniref:FAD-dependent oxidoreductase n=1 Tax=Paracoccus binzhouensis TaxID=2796149 RepID=UPI0018EECB24|nr:FAD-dependent oxidoreductase [Paracoccus binzhouensis]
MRKVAIIGSGPSGCFTAQGILKARPDWTVDVYDTLPVPYGLVRYGVAADHQGTKAITRQFERIFERQGARFFGNVTLGRDVTLEALRAAYDAVVLATGLSGDRDHGLGRAEGVIGAGQLTRALYDHPDAGRLPDVRGEVIVLGNGNVAVDVLRLLAKTEAELQDSDLGAEASAWLAGRPIDGLTILGRSPAAAARFDPVMIRELGRLQGVSIRVADLPEAGGDKLIEALDGLDGLATGPRPVTFRFGCRPAGIDTDAAGRIRALRVEGPRGPEVLACDTLITAIGFCCDGSLGRDALMAAAEDAEAGRIAAGLYAVGWFRRGPRGTIPENRAESLAVAQRIVEEVEAAPPRAGAGAGILPAGHEVVDWAGWKRLDAHELAAAIAGRCRTKITTRAGMLTLCREKEDAR